MILELHDKTGRRHDREERVRGTGHATEPIDAIGNVPHVTPIQRVGNLDKKSLRAKRRCEIATRNLSNVRELSVDAAADSRSCARGGTGGPEQPSRSATRNRPGLTSTRSIRVRPPILNITFERATEDTSRPRLLSAILSRGSARSASGRCSWEAWPWWCWDHAG